jgi:hypothetical protein
MVNQAEEAVLTWPVLLVQPLHYEYESPLFRLDRSV